MSKLETNTIDTLSGTTNLTIGSTNSSTVTFENGAVTGHNYPAFEATISSSQTVETDGAFNKILFDNEIFDTDGYYDNATNYRFTPLVAGKYFVHISVRAGENNTSALEQVSPQIRLNGVNGSYQSFFDLRANPGKAITPSFQTILDMNGTTDYIEGFCYYNSNAFGGTESFAVSGTFFGAYRIGA